MKKLLTLMTLALLAATTVRGEALDSLALLVQRGDSLMKQYNTIISRHTTRQRLKVSPASR